MKKHLMNILLASVTCFLLTLAAHAQTPAPSPTPDTVTITREAAIKCLTDSDQVKADAIEIAALKKAVEDYKSLVNDLKVELGKTAGENMQLKSSAVRADAIIDLLLKNTKARNKYGLIVF